MTQYKISVISVIIFLQSMVGNAQGFYLKPSFSYGFALNKQDLKYYGSYVESVNSSTSYGDGGANQPKDQRQKELIPLGKGKLLILEMGYENKKHLFYTLGFTLGLMDRFVANSYHEQSFYQSYNSYPIYYHNVQNTKQTVSPIWYGIEPGVGAFTNWGKYKLTFHLKAFVGKCRIRIIDEQFYEGTRAGGGLEYRIQYSHSVGNSVLKGSYMYGSSIAIGLEKPIGEKSAIGINVEYRSQVYSPSKALRKSIYNYYHLLGSVVPVSIDNDAIESSIDPYARRTYLFESFSFGISWKRYHRSHKPENKIAE